MKAFLLIGQSNMSGRGYVGQLPAVSNSHVFVLRGDKMLPAVEPVVLDKPTLAGEGLSLTFANAVWMLTGEDVCLIPCSLGGSALCEWLPGEKLYSDALNGVKLSIASGACLSGILWHQGEADSCSPQTALSYAKRLHCMMEQLVCDIRRLACESMHPERVSDPLPVIVGELGDFLDFEPTVSFHRSVNRQLHDFSALSSYYACVKAHDLPDRGDHLHFSTHSQRRLGLRYANAWADIFFGDAHSKATDTFEQ